MTIKTLLAHNKIWFALAVGWSCVVLFLCLISSDKIPSISIVFDGFDKWVHFSFHFIFTVLWLVYFYIVDKSKIRRQIVKVLIASVCFGILIEILQGSFTLTRKADVYDVLANSLGALLAAIMMYVIFNRINKLKT
jgi:VanZ family protein